MPLLLQLGGQLAHALARPTQRRLGISTRGRFDQSLQIHQQLRILVDRTLAPASGFPHSTNKPLPLRRLQLCDADPDGSAGYACCSRDRRNPSPSYRLCFRSRDTPA